MSLFGLVLLKRRPVTGIVLKAIVSGSARSMNLTNVWMDLTIGKRIWWGKDGGSLATLDPFKHKLHSLAYNISHPTISYLTSLRTNNYGAAQVSEKRGT